MSILKVGNLQHPDSNTISIQLNSAGEIVANNNMSVVGNLGIGTSTTNRFAFAYDPISGSATIGPNSTGGSTQLIFGTSNSGVFNERIRLDNTGKLGIGISAPDSLLHLFENVHTTSTMSGIYVQNFSTLNNSQAGIGFFSYDNFNSKIYTERTGTSAGNIIFATNGGGGISESNIVERMRIDSSGNVGIGTNSPQSKLEVYGAITILRNPVSSAYTSLRLFNDQNSAVRALEIDYYGSAASGGERAEISVTGAYPLLFLTSNSERMRINSSGQVYINTTGNYYGTTQFTVLRTTSGTASAALVAANAFSGDLGEPAMFIGKYDNNSSSSQIFVKFLMAQAGLGSGQINANGSGAAAFGSWSDRRLKENIVDLPPQLDNILQLRPVEFDYIESEGGGHQIGFIAQEMEEVYPDAVGERSDGMKTIAAWSKTEARLVKAIQELSAKNDALEARLTALENL